MVFTEDTFEQAVIELFEGMGYTHIYAPDMNRTDYFSPLLDSVLQDSFSGFIGGSPLAMAKLISGGANYVLDATVPDRLEQFLRESFLLKQSHSLCSSMTTEQERHEAAYFESVRSTVSKITIAGGGKVLSLAEINQQISELLKASIQSEGVINLFDSKEHGAYCGGQRPLMRS